MVSEEQMNETVVETVAEPAPKAPVAKKKTAPQASEAETARPTDIDDFLAGMTGQAFDVFAAAIGDAQTVVFREVAADAITTVGDIHAIAAALGEEVNAQRPVGRSAEVATFDIARIGGSVFIGARVRFV